MDRLPLKIHRHDASFFTDKFGEETRIESIPRSSVESYDWERSSDGFYMRANFVLRLYGKVHCIYFIESTEQVVQC